MSMIRRWWVCPNQVQNVFQWLMFTPTPSHPSEQIIISIRRGSGSRKSTPFFWYPRTNSCVGKPMIPCGVTLTVGTVTFLWFPFNAKLTFAKAVFIVAWIPRWSWSIVLGAPQLHLELITNDARESVERWSWISFFILTCATTTLNFLLYWTCLLRHPCSYFFSLRGFSLEDQFPYWFDLISHQRLSNSLTIVVGWRKKLFLLSPQ